MTSKNLSNASKALTAELEAGAVEHDDVEAYLAALDAVIEEARAVKNLYKREIAVIASRKSRAKKAQELAEMKARLEALEAAK